VQEGRKFGLGIILATQNPLNFNSDILLNTATKMIFSVEPVIHRSVSKAFGVDQSLLKAVLPRQHCMYSTKSVNNGAYNLIKRPQV
jgi:DNA helicase HerA-like ATPase